MKKFMSVLMALSFVFALSSCGKTPSESDEKTSSVSTESGSSAVNEDESSTSQTGTETTAEELSSKTDKDTTKKVEKKIKIVGNKKSEKIVSQLDCLSVDAVMKDISNIDFYLKPVFVDKKYTVKTVEDKENSTKDINYYSGDTLVYTKYEGYGETGFANYIKTASGRNATVKYYSEGSHSTVHIVTADYTVYIDNLDKNAPYGIQKASVSLLSSKTKAPFKSSVVYALNKGVATFDNATYMENGNYVRYFYDAEGEPGDNEYTDVLVEGKAPKTSDNILKLLKSDKSYGYAAILISGSSKWYCVKDNWFVKTALVFEFKDETKANEFIKMNSLDGSVEDYGSTVVRVNDVVLPISKNAVVTDNNLQGFISSDVDDAFFRKITVDNNGMITKLDNAGLSLY